MSDKAVVTCALNGRSDRLSKQHHHVPVTPEENGARGEIPHLSTQAQA